MSYSVVIRPQARKKLQSLSRPDRVRFAEKIHQLGENPDNPALDTKRGWKVSPTTA
jgi:mRNA interferase RelE/StbE